MYQRGVKTLCLHLLLILGFAVHALPSDREQVMRVMADSAQLSQLEHKGVYKGHVKFVQGTTNLQAAWAMTQANEKNQISYAQARGDSSSQAHYWTKTSSEKPDLHAYADTISYDPGKHLITLTGQARITQGSNSFAAAKIIYDTVEQHVVSDSNGETRTTIVIKPEKKLT